MIFSESDNKITNSGGLQDIKKRGRSQCYQVATQASHEILQLRNINTFSFFKGISKKTKDYIGRIKMEEKLLKF